MKIFSGGPLKMAGGESGMKSVCVCDDDIVNVSLYVKTFVKGFSWRLVE